MKAHVKPKGEIVDVVITQRVTHTGEQVYMTDDGRLIEESRLEFNVDDTPDYWTLLEHQYAGMAMQALLSSETMMVVLSRRDNGTMEEEVAREAFDYAHALVQKIKEMEEMK